MLLHDLILGEYLCDIFEVGLEYTSLKFIILSKIYKLLKYRYKYRYQRSTTGLYYYEIVLSMEY